ncbi:MAG: tyrosine-type recombinase/integrase [Tepidisphaeraceae bacterium]
MSSEIVRVTASVPEETRQQTQTDEKLIDLWVHGRSPATVRAYRAEVARFRKFVRKPLSEVTLGDIQSFADALEHESLAAASRHRCLSAVKSLSSFATKIGYLRYDVARPLKLPVLRDRLAERILSEGEVSQMLARERHPRDHVLLSLLYATAVRVSEACSLKWRDVQERSGGMGQITVLGKGGKTNTILVPAVVWQKLVTLRGDASEDGAVFRSRKGRHLHPTQVRRIVRRAARRAGIDKPVSPHWLRHASASHALDRGAPIHVVQQTLAHASVATTGRYLHVRPGQSAGSFLDLK